MLKKLAYLIAVAVFIFAGVPAQCETKIAIVPGGDPKPNELLALTEAKLFGLGEIVLLERTEIEKVLAEQKLSGLFDAASAIQLGQILKVDIFAVLEATSIVIFDAHTGLRYVDETFPEKIEDAVKVAENAVKTAVTKQRKLANGTLVTFGVLGTRNVDFPQSRDAWCQVVAGMLERALLHRGGAVLERSRLQHVNRERALTGDATNALLASMKLIDLELTRGETLASFTLTARIADETFRAESSFDNPLDVADNIAGQLLEGNRRENMGMATARATEAARFATEALFYEKISSRNGVRYWDEALEKIETAVALQPENIDYQAQLVFTLEKQTLASLFGRAKYDEEFTAKLIGGSIPDEMTQWRHRRIDDETMQQSVQAAVRLEALGKDLPPHPRFPNTPYDMEELRLALTRFASLHHQGFYAELRVLNRRFVDRWLERYRTKLKDVSDQETFQTYLRELKLPCPIIPVEHVAIYAEVVEHTLRLSQVYELQGNSIREMNDVRRVADLIRNFARCVTEAKSDNIAKTDPKTDALLERTLVLMEQNPLRISKHCAWIARNRPAGSYYPMLFYPSALYAPVMNSMNMDSEQQAAYRNKVKSYIARLPVGMSLSESEMIYQEYQNDWRVDCVLTTEEGTLNHDAFRQLIEILELADSRNECAVLAIRGYVELAAYFSGSLKIGSMSFIQQKLAEGQHEFGKYLVPAVRQQFVSEAKIEYWKLRQLHDPLARRQLALLERLMSEHRVGTAMRNDVVRVRTLAMRANIIDTPETVLTRPWKTEVNLFANLSPKKGKIVRVGPKHIHGDLLHVAGTLRNPTEQYFFGFINLKTPRQEFLPWFHENHVDILSPLHVDENNVYFKLRIPSQPFQTLGLRVSPLDGSASWSLTTDDGLPSGDIQILGTLDNKCYVVIGSKTTTHWIMRIDLKTRQGEQLSSTRAREGKTPFVDGKHLRGVISLSDPKRERILFMEFDEKPVSLWTVVPESFWTIDKDGRFAPLDVQDQAPDYPDPEKTWVSLNDNYVYNVETDTVFPRQFIFPGTTVSKSCVWDGYLWGGFEYSESTNVSSSSNRKWGRQRFGETNVEWLAVPEMFDMTQARPRRSPWYPTFCFPAPDGTGLIVGSSLGNDQGLVLLRF